MILSKTNFFQDLLLRPISKKKTSNERAANTIGVYSTTTYTEESSNLVQHYNNVKKIEKK